MGTGESSDPTVDWIVDVVSESVVLMTASESTSGPARWVERCWLTRARSVSICRAYAVSCESTWVRASVRAGVVNADGFSSRYNWAAIMRSEATAASMAMTVGRCVRKARMRTRYRASCVTVFITRYSMGRALYQAMPAAGLIHGIICACSCCHFANLTGCNRHRM
ncbi:hypothetical protein BCR44DRAFT_1437549 [Catenaria anguillulae PL171]|uniref:Uncharacterized protein n=1 Tax=Catenaria anguillulae PL171 TaxID=765915 RepID=A0A1Y2HGU2_9FUNG|nr:hypothetical protein BCR44DRAFT_1437549 [Catenaria anguillulae PL171]